MSATIDQPTAVRNALDLTKLSAYLSNRLGITGELEVLQFPGGHSNLTYLLRVGGRELVLKRAPSGLKARAAHDMGREFRVLAALHGVYRYAPRAYDYCADESILGAPFCVMQRVAGLIVRNYDASTAGHVLRAQLSGLLDALIDLHALEPRAAGLGDFGRPVGYALRQVEGWGARYQAARTDDAVDFDEVIAWLRRRVPVSGGRPAIIHNDFKLDNLVWEESNPTQLSAVLDWEMATVGDSLMDLACTLSFWVEPGDPAELKALRNMPTLAPGSPSRADAIAHYSRRTGLSLADIDFYLCFGFFRRAVIEQQKYARFVRGDTDDPRYAHLDASVQVLREICQQYVRGEA